MAQSTGDVTGTFFRNEPTPQERRERALDRALYLAEHKTKHGFSVSTEEVLEDAAKLEAHVAGKDSSVGQVNGASEPIQISPLVEGVANALRGFVLTPDENDYLQAAVVVATR